MAKVSVTERINNRSDRITFPKNQSILNNRFFIFFNDFICLCLFVCSDAGSMNPEAGRLVSTSDASLCFMLYVSLRYDAFADVRKLLDLKTERSRNKVDAL